MVRQWSWLLVVLVLSACGSDEDEKPPAEWKCAASSDGKYCQCSLGGTPGGIFSVPKPSCGSPAMCCATNQGMEDGMRTGCTCTATSELAALGQTCEQSAASLNDRVVASCPEP